MSRRPHLTGMYKHYAPQKPYRFALNEGWLMAALFLIALVQIGWAFHTGGGLIPASSSSDLVHSSATQATRPASAAETNRPAAFPTLAARG